MLICNESSLWNICHGVACSSNSSQLFSKSKLSIMRTKCTIMLFCLLKDQHIFFLSLRRYVFEEISNRNDQKSKEELIQKTDLKRDGYSTSIMGLEILRPVIYYFINIFRLDYLPLVAHFIIWYLLKM